MGYRAGAEMHLAGARDGAYITPSSPRAAGQKRFRNGKEWIAMLGPTPEKLAWLGTLQTGVR